MGYENKTNERAKLICLKGGRRPAALPARSRRELQRHDFAIGEGRLIVLLCHKFALWQQGHRGSRRAILRANLMRMLVMDDLTSRSVRIGGSAASKTVG